MRGHTCAHTGTYTRGILCQAPSKPTSPLQVSVANKKQGQQEEETELGMGDLILVGATNVRQGRKGLDSSRKGEPEVFSMVQGLWGVAGFLCS